MMGKRDAMAIGPRASDISNDITIALDNLDHQMHLVTSQLVGMMSSCKEDIFWESLVACCSIAAPKSTHSLIV